MTVNQQAGPMTGIPSTGGSPAAPEPGKSRRGADILVEVLRSERRGVCVRQSRHDRSCPLSTR